MEFEDIEVDDDLFEMLDQAARSRAPAAAPAPPPPIVEPKPDQEVTSSPPKPATTFMYSRPGRWIPGQSSHPAPAPVAPPTPSISAPPPQQQESLTKESIGGAASVLIELTYGGKSRIRVTVSAQAPISVFAKKSPFHKANAPTPPEKPPITASTLPQFIRAAFAKTIYGQNVTAWDVPCEDPTWPSYEERALDFESRNSATLAHWLFPARVLPQLDLNLRRSVEEENLNQNRLPYGSKVALRYVSLPEYVRKLILECSHIYQNAECIANNPGPEASPDSAISTILPQRLLEMDLFKALKDYQVRGVEYAFCRNGRLLLADAPGLGKTLQAIAIACCYAEDWPVLVICPSSVRAMWANEFERWIPDLTFADISTNFTGKKTSLKAKVNVISYELLKSPKIMESVWSLDPRTQTQRHPFGVIICDECHLLKTFKSARTQAILPLIQKAKRAVMLSGTPATSRPSELHTQLAAVLPRVFQFFPNFGDRYCDPKPTPFGNGSDYSGASNTYELHLLLTEALMIRRLKSEVLADMPAKRRHQLLLEIPKETRDALVEMSKEMRRVGETIGASGSGFGAKKGRKPKKTTARASVMDEATEVGDSETLDLMSLRGRQHTLVLEMFQNAGRAKLPAAIAHLKNCLANEPPETKFLVFAHHLDILNGFSHAMRESGTECIRIDGSTLHTARQPLVDHFQTTPSCRVAILSIMAAGVGITLTRASKVFFAELYWDPGALLQAEDRAHRYGQDRDVDVYYMIAKDSYDEKLWDAVDMKLSVLSAVLDAKQAQLSVDSVSKGSGSASAKAADSFIGYLLQKIDGFYERADDAQERSQTKRKVRNGTFFQDDPIEDSNTSSVASAPQQRQSPPFKMTSSSRETGEQAMLPSSSTASSSSHTSIPRPAPSVISLDLDSDDDSFEALMREPPLKKLAPLPLDESFPPIIQAPATSNPLPPSDASSAAVEQKRLDKLARFAMLD